MKLKEKPQDAGERDSCVDVTEEVGVSQERTTGALAFLSIPSARARTLEPGCLQRMPMASLGSQPRLAC